MLATAKSHVLMHTAKGVLDEASNSHPAGVPLYAFHDPGDTQTVGGDYKLLDDGPCPRLAVGVPVLESKVASAAAKAAAWDQLHPGAAQLGSSELAARLSAERAKAEKAEKDAKKARRLDMEREVSLRLGVSGATSGSGSMAAPFTPEEEEWIARKVERRRIQQRAATAAAAAAEVHAELEAARAAGGSCSTAEATTAPPPPPDET